MTAVGLLIGLARMGFRGSITERCLSSLVMQAQDHGVAEVLTWVADDPGLLWVRTHQGGLYA
jgi:hypothetical protein